MINRILPASLKESVKLKIQHRFHLAPSRSLDIANRIVTAGIPNYIAFSFGNLKNDVLNYTKNLNISDYQYKYAASSPAPVLYASAYACMIYGYFGELEKLDDSKKQEWADYFNHFQGEDGYFRDPGLAGEEFEGDVNWGDGWGIRHLAAHLIIAYARLGQVPKYPFRFLEPYYTTHFVEGWLNDLFCTKNMWSASNYIMNIVTLLQYSRDYMNDQKAEETIDFVLNWLQEKQNPETGLWHNDKIENERDLHNAIRGAYHYFPLFIYEKRSINYQKNVIDNILKTQNSWGGFEEEMNPSGACEDIDALDPLIRFTILTKYKKAEVDEVVKKALVWILANKNTDVGFTFMPETPHHYGNHSLTSSLKGESNLFATWFRTLCLAYMVNYLQIENEFIIGRFPGYELPLD